MNPSPAFAPLYFLVLCYPRERLNAVVPVALQFGGHGQETMFAEERDNREAKSALNSKCSHRTRNGTSGSYVGSQASNIKSG